MKICYCDTPFVTKAKNQRFCEECGLFNKKVYDRKFAKRQTHRRHGVSDEQFSSWVLLGCAVCGTEFTETPHVDHDHKHCAGRNGCKDCVRGLLCKCCNMYLISAIEKNPKLRLLVAKSILDYVDKHREPGPESSLA